MIKKEKNIETNFPFDYIKLRLNRAFEEADKEKEKESEKETIKSFVESLFQKSETATFKKS